MVKIKGFYTDEQKRIRPITEYFKEYEERGKIEEHKQELVQKITSLPPVDPRPKSARQAMELLSRGQLMAVEAQGLQIVFDKINQEKFKGKVPKTQILFARLPNVKNYGFCTILNDGRRCIVVNVARAKNREEQEKVLKHEMIHAGGILSHDFRFKIWCQAIEAPFAITEDGRFLSVDDYEKEMMEREVKREKERERKRVEAYRKFREQHPELFTKPHARILGWEERDGHFIVPHGSVYAENVPVNAKNIIIVLFDEDGRPTRHTEVKTRKELLEKYFVIP